MLQVAKIPDLLAEDHCGERYQGGVHSMLCPRRAMKGKLSLEIHLVILVLFHFHVLLSCALLLQQTFSHGGNPTTGIFLIMNLWGI